jgi:hypothetical protein
VTKNVIKKVPNIVTIYIPEQEGYGVVSKPVSQSTYQNLTDVMSFDTILV